MHFEKSCTLKTVAVYHQLNECRKIPVKGPAEIHEFLFHQQGSKGGIHKVIQFQDTGEYNLYNLAFGDVNQAGGEPDDLVVSNNGDTEKVLATVVDALYVFYQYYPHASVYATGSTPARIRLYRIGITRFYKEMQGDFFLYGQVGEEFFPFELGKTYDGFLVQRKFA